MMYTKLTVAYQDGGRKPRWPSVAPIKLVMWVSGDLTGMQGRGKWKIPDKTRRPAGENPGAAPAGIRTRFAYVGGECETHDPRGHGFESQLLHLLGHDSSSGIIKIRRRSIGMANRWINKPFDARVMEAISSLPKLLRNRYNWKLFDETNALTLGLFAMFLRFEMSRRFAVELMRALRCPGCRKLFDESIRQCALGHSVCNTCYERWGKRETPEITHQSRLPQAKIPVDVTRNRTRIVVVAGERSSAAKRCPRHALITFFKTQLPESPISTTARTPVLLVSGLELTIVLLVYTTPDTTLYFTAFFIGRPSTNGEPS
ncbi:hypothetical protein PR048_032113 [Dryococelus australis]|uniref:E3 ubiquitin-protein ligase Sina-like RING finger domain-containing protein n=1 Tax=Dryococelus australis TaxID=614101 RepID=A0ABQ9G1B5_9NEOP|nr:hypothetical protein PR048_032113 [Dryococelus australis]